MKKILYALIFISFAFGDTYYAKLEPFESVTIKAQANGEVLVSKDDLEGKIGNGLIVKIDDKLDIVNLKSSQEQLKLTKQMIAINSATLDTLKSNMIKKLALYKKVAPLSSTSVSAKDNIFSAYVAAKTQYSATREKILNLKSQKVNLEQKIATLKDVINKKNIKVHNKYIYSLNVKKGEFVNIGYPLMAVQDISKAKLVVYLNEDDLKDLDKKTIYIDGKKTNLKFNKVWRVADKQYISSYRAEIVTKPFKRFSKLVKVEVK